MFCFLFKRLPRQRRSNFTNSLSPTHDGWCGLRNSDHLLCYYTSRLSISDKSLRMIGAPLLFRPSSFAYEDGECMVAYALITRDREEYGMLHWQTRIPLRPLHARETRANNAAPHNTHSESLVNLADRLVSDNTQYFQRSKTYRFLPTGRHSTIDIEFRGDELNAPEDRLYTSSRFTRNLCGGTCCPSRTTCLTER